MRIRCAGRVFCLVTERRADFSRQGILQLHFQFKKVSDLPTGCASEIKPEN